MVGTELGRGVSRVAIGRVLFAAPVAALLDPDIHLSCQRVAAAKLWFFVAALVPVGGSDGAAPHTAPLVAHVDHAFKGVPRAELGPLAPVHAVGRPGGATFVAAALAANVHHAYPRVPRAVLGLLRAVDTVRGASRAGLVAAPLASDIHHAVLGVPRAELSLRGAVDTVGGPRDATSVPASLASDIDHSVSRVLRAELGPGAAVSPVGRPLDASAVTALLHHPSQTPSPLFPSSLVARFVRVSHDTRPRQATQKFVQRGLFAFPFGRRKAGQDDAEE